MKSNFTQNPQVFMEEWLTDYRAKLMKKCKTLLKVYFMQNSQNLKSLTLMEIHAALVHINSQKPSHCTMQL